MEKQNNYTVYKHTSPSGKVYIGITGLSVEKRWKNGVNYRNCRHFYNAILKYGWDNIKHEILFTELTKEQAESKEVELIELYNSDNSNYGYNIQHGGNISCGVHSEETKAKQSKAAKEMWKRKGFKEEWISKRVGKKKSKDCKKKQSIAAMNRTDNKRQVLQYDLDGNFIKKYKGMREAERETGANASSIMRTCQGKQKTSGGYIWKYV